MSKEYIDREVALAAANKGDKEHGDRVYFTWESLRYFINCCPAADVVEVVRCKECRFWNTTRCAFKKDCIPELPDADDFCSHGETVWR